MYSAVMTGAVHGIGSYLLRVETNITNGLPAFNMVGVMSGEIRPVRGGCLESSCMGTADTIPAFGSS